MNSANGTHQEGEEDHVVMGGVAWLEEIDAVIGTEGPVVVLAAAVEACEGLLVQEADKAVT